MKFQNLSPDKSISLFVKNIWVFESAEADLKTNLPFFADGYPGLMFQQTNNGLKVNPHRKQMPVLFLYGQTIRPIELEIKGAYQLIVFQLYPFVLKSLFNISPHTINDDCYDLQKLQELNMSTFTQQLISKNKIDEKVESISLLLYQLFQSKRQNLDLKIKQVIESIITTKGREKVSAIARNVKINARTLERRFFNETGLSPKQFSKIIQFQSSLEQITVKDYTKLTDVVYENGFTDQSHFIKVFKGFTGRTPKTLSKK